MKQITIIITLLCSTLVMYGQKYHTLKACNNDPLKYIEKNYQDNANKYIGKTIGYWADECEIELDYYVPVEYSPWGTPKNLIGKIEKIRFDIYYKEYNYNIYIYIDPSTPLDWNTAVDLEGDYDETWSKKFYNFYKNAKIKKISIGKRKGEKYNIKYRRP